jgi:hypothetical protein
MMKNSFPLLVSLSLLTLLAGCGRTPAAAPYSNRMALRPALQSGAPNGAATGYGAPQVGAGLTGAPGAPGAPNLQALMASVRQAQQAQQGFTGSIDTWEKGPDNTTSSQTLSAWWKRPSTLKITITKGDSTSQGVSASWDGSNTMKVKPGYLPFAMSMPITDSRIVSKNGWTIKDTDISGMLGVLLDPGAQVQMVGPQVVDGKAVTMVTVHSPKSPKGVTQEQMGIDPIQNVPVVRLMYKGPTIVYKLVAKTFKLSVPSSSETSL